MPYSLQTFAFNQVLTAAQMNQVEANIKDHVHGVGGVAATGLSWNYTSISSAQSIQPTDAGKHYLCSPYTWSSGTMVLDLSTVGDLGAGWAATFTNVGSMGVVLLDPSTTEKIHGNSEYCIGIGETVLVHCDGNELFCYGNHVGAPVLLHRFISSNADIGSGTVICSYNVAWDTMQWLDLLGGFSAVSAKSNISLRVAGVSVSSMSWGANEKVFFEAQVPGVAVSSLYLEKGWIRAFSEDASNDPYWVRPGGGNFSWRDNGVNDNEFGNGGGTPSNIYSFAMEVWGRRAPRQTYLTDAPDLNI